MTGLETASTALGGAAVLVINWLITRASTRQKADSGELTSLTVRVNILTVQNESQQKTIDRSQSEIEKLNIQLITCHAHRDQLIVERDKLSQQLVMILINQQEQT